MYPPCWGSNCRTADWFPGVRWGVLSGQLYAGHASQLAERMAHIREKEMARREAFTKQQERFLPTVPPHAGPYATPSFVCSENYD